MTMKMTRLGPGVGREAVMRVVGRLTEAVTIVPTSVLDAFRIRISDVARIDESTLKARIVLKVFDRHRDSLQ